MEMQSRSPHWRELAAAQGGLITRRQLTAAGVHRNVVARRVGTERWMIAAPTVISTTTGELGRAQLMWLGVLHAGRGSALAGLTAAEAAGLRNWHRDDIAVIVPYGAEVPVDLPGIVFSRSRRPLGALHARGAMPPRLQLEPAILLFAAADRSERTAQGVLAAAVQQQLTTPEALLACMSRLRPLRRAPLLRRALEDMAGGAQSLAEMDIRRMCHAYGIARPARQVKRRDLDGRLRYTDCEWRLLDGRILVLEVDGAFHMDVEHWEDDLARQRALSASDRLIVRCTAREIRDAPERVARDLRILGVPRAA